jgi:hypothetical protein
MRLLLFDTIGYCRVIPDVEQVHSMERSFFALHQGGGQTPGHDLNFHYSLVQSKIIDAKFKARIPFGRIRMGHQFRARGNAGLAWALERHRAE